MPAATESAKWKLSLRPVDEVGKIAYCDKNSGDMTGRYDVWVRRYTGCTENQGRVGPRTAKLTVDGDVSWEFTP
jgi:hypothetical protein